VSEHIDPIFLVWARNAIRTLQDSDLNDTLIACVVTEIRSAAIHEERLRQQRLQDANPPHHAGHTEMAGLLADRCAREDSD
jgi:hypothetical protein